MNDLAARLRELAEAATPGPWYTDRGGTVWRGKWSGALLRRASVNERGCEDARFVAAANPEAVLVLLRRLSELEQEKAAWQTMSRRWASRARTAERLLVEIAALSEAGRTDE